MANRAEPSSSSTFTYGWAYDVFLSFRGEDTRYNFVGNLYDSLRQRGIRTFIDDEKLRRGEEITPALFKAIEESRIAIIVFSKNYASSTFCLNELVKILEQSKGEGRLIWPVFYGVDPSELRHQRGSYGEALSRHRERFKDDEEKVQKWKQALKDAAKLSGWHFNLGQAYEYQFVEGIVEEVSRRINRIPLHIADYPVGLESRVQRIRSIVGVGSDDKVNMVGICGVGGIGKTTIARAVYNSIADQFEDLCFLADVRKKSSSEHGLVQLQEKLLSDLVSEKAINLGDVDRGIPIIKRRLHKKKVLVILDDVDNYDQLKALAGGCDWFGSGSIIIITTRDRHLLRNREVEKMYEVEGLNYDESLDLLRWNAFKRNEFDPSYQDIMNSLIDFANGHPLALEIIGSNLSGKTMDEWKSLSETYRKIPIKRINEVLKVSYDGLGEGEQKIFLDIASFFKGSSYEYVLKMVHHARGFREPYGPHYGIGVLIDKSLIKIERGYVEMHDLVQDMGRDIVRQQSDEPGERSRLWSCEDITHVLEEDTGTHRVEVIIMSLPVGNVHNVHWSGKAFKGMKNLRILIINNVTFSRGPEHLPNSLRVLEWRGYPSSSLPADFHPRELFILHLDGSCISSLKPFMGFKNLTDINFDWCRLITQIPDVSCLPNLTEISFMGCDNLVKIHDSIGRLDKLRILTAPFCRKLRRFPPINLPNLEKLWLVDCSSLQIFPEILGEIKNITHLSLSGTDMEFPSSIQNLTGLKSIAMTNCRRIRLPIAFALLPKLTELHIGLCEKFQVSKQDQGKEMGSLLMCQDIERLVLGADNISKESLSTCLSWFCNVKTLQLSSSNFTILPTCIKECHSLRELYLDGCKHLREIRGVPPNIQDLSAKNCTLLSSQSKSILLSQELHDTGGKIFSLPGETIPEWFDHCNRGGSISFWFRNKFPAIALCVVIGSVNEQSFTVMCTLNLIINGSRPFRGRGFRHILSAVVNHIFVCDLQRMEFFDEEEEASLEEEWNHAEVSCAPPLSIFSQYHDEFPFEKVAKESGIYVFKQKSRMEDIRFTKPYTENEGDEICSPTPSEPSVDNGESPSELLPSTKVRKEKEQPTSSNKSMMDDKGNDVKSDPADRWQFSLCALISSVVLLCSSLTDS